MSNKNITILIVDDTPDIILLLTALLEVKEYNVESVGSGAEAIELVPELQPDLILMDVMMPEMDGYQTAQKLLSNEANKNIPIVFVTAKTGPSDIAKGFEYGAKDYITKPITPEEVWARVDHQIELARLLKKQKLLISQLNAQEQRSRTIIRSANNPMLTVSPPGQITSANPAAAKFFGYEEAQLVGSDLTLLLAPEFQESVINCFEPESLAMAEKDSMIDSGDHKVTAICADGHQVVVDLAINSLGLGYPVFLCHFHDLSHLNR